MTNKIRRGLYAITDDLLIAPEELLNSAEQAILGGAVMIQYRSKFLDVCLKQRQAAELVALCQRHAVPLIINDDVELALRVGADGVHLGKSDHTIEVARTLLGDNAIIGISCYNELARAQQAKEAGADYIAFGRFFSSQTKPLAIQATISLIGQAKPFGLPIAVIGGIRHDNASSLIEAGADLLAVVQGVFGQTNVFSAAQKFTALMKNFENTA